MSKPTSERCENQHSILTINVPLFKINNWIVSSFIFLDIFLSALITTHKSEKRLIWNFKLIQLKPFRETTPQVNQISISQERLTLLWS